MKIVNIEVTKNQNSTLFLKNTFLEKPHRGGGGVGVGGGGSRFSFNTEDDQVSNLEICTIEPLQKLYSFSQSRSKSRSQFYG